MCSIMMALSVVLAFLLDYGLGEAKKFHPLVGFGHLANFIESRLNKRTEQHLCVFKANKSVWYRSNLGLRILGVFAYLIVVMPMVVFVFFLEHLFTPYDIAHMMASSGLVYVCIGWKSLRLHAQAIIKPLSLNPERDNSLPDEARIKARYALSMIVSRDTDALKEKEIAKAATESVLENGADAIFSAVFWFCLLGWPGVILYRLSNTLDAMWGYKSERFLYFGWFSARVDDVLNFIPARLCALSYALLGSSCQAFGCWKDQAAHWKSPNAGPVMAAGAGALNVSLGGAAMYDGQWQSRPILGPQETPLTKADAGSISKACGLITRSIILWCFILLVYDVLL